MRMLITEFRARRSLAGALNARLQSQRLANAAAMALFLVALLVAVIAWRCHPARAAAPADTHSKPVPAAIQQLEARVAAKVTKVEGRLGRIEADVRDLLWFQKLMFMVLGCIATGLALFLASLLKELLGDAGKALARRIIDGPGKGKEDKS